MKTYKNILVINFGGIGDEILFLPVISSLREKFPESKITLCLEKRSGSFVSLIDLVDNHFFININTKTKYLELLKLLFKGLVSKYDLVISSGSNPLISLLLFCTGIKTRVGYGTSKLSKLLLTYPVTLNKEQYASEMYFDLVKPITNDTFKLPYIKFQEYEKIPNSVLVHPGVSLISVKKQFYKTFSGKVWADVIKELLRKGKKVYLAGGPDDDKCISEIRENLKDTDLSNFTDMFGKTKNLKDLLVLIKQSEVLLCSDSAPMHLGVALRTKTVAFFGPTDEKKLLPQSKEYIAVTKDIACRPCLWDKRLTSCPESQCLDIEVSKVVNAVMNI